MSKDETETTSTADFNPAKARPIAEPSPLVRIFAPNKIDESKLKIKCSVSEGVCRVQCVATGVGASFRVSSHPDLLEIVESKHDETVEWEKKEHKKALENQKQLSF